jgi:molybdopterin-binding protein
MPDPQPIRSSNQTQADASFVTQTAATAMLPGLKGAGASELVDGAVSRVTTSGVPAFQLRQGEQGLSVFDASKVGPTDILSSFREGSGLVTKPISEIQGHGLTVEPTPGDPSLPQNLQDAHMEIKPGPDMTRNQFKQAVKKLNDQQ